MRRQRRGGGARVLSRLDLPHSTVEEVGCEGEKAQECGTAYQALSGTGGLRAHQEG